MQIGFPTDVKHVAHIGLDGPSAVNSPSWVCQSPPFDPLVFLFMMRIKKENTRTASVITGKFRSF